MASHFSGGHAIQTTSRFFAADAGNATTIEHQLSDDDLHLFQVLGYLEEHPGPVVHGTPGSPEPNVLIGSDEP